MPQVNINKKHYDQTAVLKARIGEKEYSIPLAKHLPYKYLRTIKDGADIDAVLDLFANYIPREVLDDLTLDSIKQLMEAWANASKDDGTELGK